jgi:hypothetical protein
VAFDRQRVERWLERERALAERGITRRQDPNLMSAKVPRKTAAQTPVSQRRSTATDRRRHG